MCLICWGRSGGDGVDGKQSRDGKRQEEKKRKNKPSFTADKSHNKLDIHSLHNERHHEGVSESDPESLTVKILRRKQLVQLMWNLLMVWKTMKAVMVMMRTIKTVMMKMMMMIWWC